MFQEEETIPTGMGETVETDGADVSMKTETTDTSKPGKPEVNADTSVTANVGFYLRMRGLPWGCSKEQIIEFFAGVPCERPNINLLFMPDGKASGEALVGFDTQVQLDDAMKKDKQYIESRYIELYPSSPQEWERVSNRQDRNHSVPINQNSFVVLMRGLPYSVHEDDCIEFFQPHPCLGVHLTKDSLGRPSGQGYAEFETREAFNEALKFHKKNLHNRYIELFESSIQELVNAVSGRTERVSKNTTFSNGPAYGYTTSIVGGEAPTCIKMRGLPYNTTESDITAFFQREKVTPSRIHRKQNGAEAFVEFMKPSDGTIAMKLNKAFMGKRYVELFMVDYNEMAEQVGLREPPYRPGPGPPPGGRGGFGGYGGGAYGAAYGGPGGQRYDPYRSNGPGGPPYGRRW